MKRLSICVILTLAIVGIVFAGGCFQPGKIERQACPYECCLGDFYEARDCQPNYSCIGNSCTELKRVSVRNTEFLVGGAPYRFIGAFSFPIVTHLIYEEWRPNWKREIDGYLDSLKLVDVNVIRFFAFGIYEARISGRSEPNWERLDYFINECEDRGIYVIFNLWDYWDYWDEGTVADHVYAFWEDERIKPLLERMVNRYKNSNAIFAWEVMNEGDLMTIGDNYSELFEWTKEITEFVKELDSEHIVSTGFSHETLRESFFEDPAFYQIARDRTIEINSLQSIDFVTFHGYGGPIDDMQDVKWYDSEWKEQMEWYINEAAEIRAELKKPILFEEWGAHRTIGEPARAEAYSFILGLFEENMIDNIFNGWGDDPAKMLIYSYDTAEVELIRESVKKIKEQE